MEKLLCILHTELVSVCPALPGSIRLSVDKALRQADDEVLCKTTAEDITKNRLCSLQVMVYFTFYGSETSFAAITFYFLFFYQTPSVHSKPHQFTVNFVFFSNSEFHFVLNYMCEPYFCDISSNHAGNSVLSNSCTFVCWSLCRCLWL